MTARHDEPDVDRLCEWASLTDEQLPEEYGPCGPERDA